MASEVEKDIEVLMRFIDIYCKTKHKDAPKSRYIGLNLCPECQETLEYAIHRRKVCQLDPKPTCKNCEIHCYKPDQRQRIKEIMRNSGMHMIKRGRLDWIIHYFF
jgi:hypothetical protein